MSVKKKPAIEKRAAGFPLLRQKKEAAQRSKFDLCRPLLYTGKPVTASYYGYCTLVIASAETLGSFVILILLGGAPGPATRRLMASPFFIGTIICSPYLIVPSAL